ncbi:MAG: hypothetical protein DRJ28_00220 [Actinobacteria bacterium]|nr:MAG: hypothetical protein DRJ28_00220 [Actinomycetota bacterium]
MVVVGAVVVVDDVATVVVAATVVVVTDPSVVVVPSVTDVVESTDGPGVDEQAATTKPTNATTTMNRLPFDTLNPRSLMLATRYGLTKWGRMG